MNRTSHLQLLMQEDLNELHITSTTLDAVGLNELHITSVRPEFTKNQSTEMLRIKVQQQMSHATWTMLEKK
ncbi:hypothetical protein DPMN_113461 [Dreissena polymorpha]|uniref:Uncharacterized protein n=1 Tax=Dreissena polymorpha TaxID=45954 RepID=A0A9D4KIG8_DREPO|nr:hypothetical protein DPMN_113461 [Dreissena polymorpha]